MLNKIKDGITPSEHKEIVGSLFSGGGGGASPFYTARAHWDDMNGTYVLDTPSSEILEASKTKIGVIIATEVSGAQTFYWQTMQGGSEVITFVNATPDQIAQLAVIKDEPFADVIINNQLGN